MNVNRKHWWAAGLLAVLLVVFWQGWGDSESEPVVDEPESKAVEQKATFKAHAHRRHIHEEECAACPDVPPIKGEKKPSPPDTWPECKEILMTAVAAGDPFPDTSHLGNCFNITPLHLVRNLDNVHTLLNNGADPNARDHVGRTPLHRMAHDIRADSELVDALLAAGADPDLEDDRGRTAYYLSYLRPNLRRSEHVSNLLVAEIAAETLGITMEEFYQTRPHWKALVEGYVQESDESLIRVQVSLRKASEEGRRLREMNQERYAQ